jgi:hypothetical protein
MYKYFHDERQPLDSKNNLVYVSSEAASQSGGAVSDVSIQQE